MQSAAENGNVLGKTAEVKNDNSKGLYVIRSQIKTYRVIQKFGKKGVAPTPD